MQSGIVRKAAHGHGGKRNQSRLAGTVPGAPVPPALPQIAKEKFPLCFLRLLL